MTYQEPPSLRFQSDWSNVERVVRLSSSPDSIALLLRAPGIRIGDSRRLTDAERSTPYPFLRTVPLQPFIDSFAGSELERRLHELIPDAFERPLERFERPTQTLSRRALGVAIIMMPGPVIASVALARGVPLPIVSTIFAIIVALLLLVRYWGWTGERLPDAVARLLIHPARGESRFGALVPVAFLYLFVYVAGFAGPQLTSRPSGPSCSAVAFADAPPLPEPSWPGTPTGTMALELGPDWRTAPLTESGVQSMVAGESKTFVDSFVKSVRGYIRGGLIQLGVTRLTDGGVTVLYLYELSCAETATQADIVFPADHPSSASVSEATREHIEIGPRSFVRASYRLSESGGVALFRIYEWVEHGHVFRLVTRNDGPGDQKDTIEGILGKF